MQKNPSWKLNENYKLLNNKFDNVIQTSIKFSNTLNESDLEEVEKLLAEASDRGWYPFVSEIYKDFTDIAKFDYICEVEKDELIFEFLMLEQEVHILEEFGEIDLMSFKDRIEKLKLTL